MKKVVIFVLAAMLCVTTAYSSTFGMEGQNVDSGTVSLNIGDYVLLDKYRDEPIL
jgi:signal peptidase I